jgi:hypothetical protein
MIHHPQTHCANPIGIVSKSDLACGVTPESEGNDYCGSAPATLVESFYTCRQVLYSVVLFTSLLEVLTMAESLF